MIDDYVRNRLQNEYDLQETKLRNLFGFIYRDRDTAWEKWENTVSRSGIDVAVKRFSKKPRHFGKMRGRAWFGFWKDKAFKDRIRALKEARTVSENWYSARLQLESTGDRIKNVKTKVEQTLEKERKRERQQNRVQDRGRIR